METEDEGRKGLKRPASEMADHGTKAEATGGSVFNVLAGRMALKCPLDEDFVNSASATTAQVKGKHPFVANPSSASAATGIRGSFKPISVRMDSAAYAYGPSGIWYEDHLEDGRIVREIKYPRPVKSAPTHLENLLRAANLKR